jgi:membrane protein YqaA with SNARE-associated domain
VEHKYFPFACAFALIWYYLTRLSPETLGKESVLFMTEREADISFASWWITVGILSSVGMGSGLHTGMLWLFPHIYMVVNTANRLGHWQFDPRENRWCLPAFMADSVGSDIASYMGACKWEFEPTNKTFAAPVFDPFVNGTTGAGLGQEELIGAVSYVAPFWDLYANLWLATFFWGAGTALGESPPYFVARAAKLAGEENQELLDMYEEQGAGAGGDAFKKMMDWMIDIVERYGWWGVFAFSSFPNALFDVCGMCCGQAGMSYFEFMSACMLGKAAVKACILQLAGFIIAFSPWHLAKVGSTFEGLPVLDVLAEKLQGAWEGINQKTADTIKSYETGKESVSADAEAFGLKQAAGMLMGLFVFGMIFSFVASIIVQFAQQYQAKVDKEEIEEVETNGKKKK